MLLYHSLKYELYTSTIPLSRGKSRKQSGCSGKYKKAMDDIEKALQELAKAVEISDTVAGVKVTITLKKPKPSKAKPDK